MYIRGMDSCIRYFERPTWYSLYLGIGTIIAISLALTKGKAEKFLKLAPRDLSGSPSLAPEGIPYGVQYIGQLVVNHWTNPTP